MHEKPIEIAKLQRWSTEPAIENKWKLFERKIPVNSSSGTGRKKVAIVGAGPAGLSCAHVLSREGIDVTCSRRKVKAAAL